MANRLPTYQREAPWTICCYVPLKIAGKKPDLNEDTFEFDTRERRFTAGRCQGSRGMLLAMVVGVGGVDIGDLVQ